MPFLSVASPDSMMSKANLYYEDRTREQVRTIVFLHDWALNGQEWAYPIALFSRGYRTVTIDMPGFGRSDQPGGLISYESLARDVGALTTVLDLRRIVLVGAGLGAGVAVAFATHFPRTLAGLVLVGAPSPRLTRAQDFPAGVPRHDIERLLEESESNWPDVLRRFVGSLFHTEVGEPTRQWFMQMGFEASLYMVQQCLMLLRDADQQAEITRIAVPTAVFHGRHDVIVPPAIGEYLADQIPQGQFVGFEHSGHAVWVDEKVRFNRELTGFIEQRVYGNVLPPPGTERTPGGGERLPFKEIATAPHRGPPQIEGATGEIYE